MTDYFTGYDEILENKLGITDPAVLKQAEADIVFVRLTELIHNYRKGSFDFSHLKAIHKHLFSDLYPMAGLVRTVNLTKGGSVFCYCENINAMQKEIFGRLQTDCYLKGLGISEYSTKLAELSGNLNALHPFREGNGRAIRCFLVLLSINAGFDLQFEKTDSETLLAADISAFNGDTSMLVSLYERIISPL